MICVNSSAISQMDFPLGNFTHMTEALHLLQNAIDVWHHVFALDHDGSVGAVPQSHVEHSAALCVHK